MALKDMWGYERMCGADDDLALIGDIEQLRHTLADRLDAHPIKDWSAPLLLAIIGVLDASSLNMVLEARESRRSRLRMV